MAQIEVLSKILHIREKEEKDAQIAHHQSVVFFEKMATKLYQLLRKKEAAEAAYEKTMKKPTTIDLMKEQLKYIELLNKQIIELQSNVNHARSQMESKQEKLTSAHVEVKRFEKLIDQRKGKQKVLELKLEQDSMDEVSNQQYISRKLGEYNGKTNQQ